MSDQKPTAATIQNNSVMLPNGIGKAAAVAPKLSDDDHVEMEDMLPSEPIQSPEEDIMQRARLGDIQGIERLYESKKFDATYCDAEGITPLHVIALDFPMKLWLMRLPVGSYQ
jgi:palmitoyltransferase